MPREYMEEDASLRAVAARRTAASTATRSFAAAVQAKEAAADEALKLEGGLRSLRHSAERRRR